MPRDRTTRKLYNRPDDRRQNDPTDDGRAIAGPMPPKREYMGRTRGVSLRSVFDRGRYILSTGRRWRALPTDIHRIPPTGTVSTPGAQAVRRACPAPLRDPARQCAGRSQEPAAAVMVHAAGIQDRDGAPDAIAKPPVTAPNVRGLRAGGGHPGPKPRGRPDGTGPADIIGTVGKPEDVKGFTVP